MRHPIGRHNAGAGNRRKPMRDGALRFPAKHSDGSHEADGRASRGSTGSQARGEGIDCQWARLVPRSLILSLPFPAPLLLPLLLSRPLSSSLAP